MSELAAPSRDAWLLEPSVDFTRDVRGSAWIDHPTERTVRGRAKRARAARISGYAHQVASTFSLDVLDRRYVLLGAMRMQPIELAVLGDLDPEDNGTAKVLDEAVALAQADAGMWFKANRGTCIHKMLEYVDRGQEWPQELVADAERYGIDEEARTRLAASWRALLARYGLRVVAIEQTVAVDYASTGILAAGTLDRLVELEREVVIAGHVMAAGSIVVLDIKSSALWLANGIPAYWGPYTCQVALYARSDPYLVGADRQPDHRRPWPWPIDVVNGLIGHVNAEPREGPVGTCSLWHADIAAGFELAQLALAARKFEARRDLFAPAP